MNKTIITTIVVVVLVALGFLIVRQRKPTIDGGVPESQTREGGEILEHTKGEKKVPDTFFARLAAITLVTYAGAEASLAEYAGAPLVVNSWAVWCPFCREELPDFAAVQEEFPDEVRFIAIDRRESLATAKGFTDEIGVTDRMTFLLDPADDFYKAIGGFSMPETIFVDTDGGIVFHKRGPMTREEMRAKVIELGFVNQ